MPDYEALYPGRFMKGKALEGPKVIRIVGVAATDLEGDDGMKAKCVVKYKAADGPGEIVWCKTNAALTAAILDERDYTKWAGHLITLRFDPTVKFGADTPGGIRVCGSPELKAPKRVSIKRPKRTKPEVYTLVPTDKKGQPLAPEPAKVAQASPSSPATTDGPPPDDAWMHDAEPGSEG